jgi:glutaredoxin-like YruB-family protein
MSDLTVYTSPTCPWCTRLKNYLNEKGVSFSEVDVSTDYDGAMKMVDLTGQRSVPVITKGDRYVVGFDPEQIERVLQ